MSRDIIDYRVCGTEFQFLDPDDSVPKETMPGVPYEPSVATLLHRILASDGHVLMDVGAHYGYFSVFAKRTNPKTSVHAFEPGANHRAILNHNLDINQTLVDVHGYALSDENETVPFSDRTLKVDSSVGAVTVEAIRFDDLNQELAINPTVVKVDVHGAEGKVLHGMPSSLHSDVRHLFVEIHARHLLSGDYSYADIVDFLDQLGFLVFEVERFRYRQTPNLTLLEGESYEQFTQYELWSEDQINFERMLYAFK